MIQLAGIAGQGDQKTLDPAVKERPDTFLFLIHGFPGLTDDQVVALLADHLFNAGNHGRLKIAVQARQDHPNGVRFVFSQVTGKGILLVTHGLRRCTYPANSLLPDLGMAA